MTGAAIAFAFGTIPLLTLLAVMWKRRREDKPASIRAPLTAVAERNLRSFVVRYVPDGPDRDSAMNCIEALATAAQPGGSDNDR